MNKLNKSLFVLLIIIVLGMGYILTIDTTNIPISTYESENIESFSSEQDFKNYL